MVPWPDFFCLEAPRGSRLTPPSLLPGLGQGGHLPGNGRDAVRATGPPVLLALQSELLALPREIASVAQDSENPL